MPLNLGSNQLISACKFARLNIELSAITIPVPAKPFIETLFDYIDKKGITDVECYKKANVDRKTFNKLKNNPDQRPTKQIAIAFAIALKLNLEETQHLLSTAGLTLSKSNVFDKIIRYFIHTGNYDIFQINEALFEFDQISLGSFYH